MWWGFKAVAMDPWPASAKARDRGGGLSLQWRLETSSPWGLSRAEPVVSSLAQAGEGLALCLQVDSEPAGIRREGGELGRAGELLPEKEGGQGPWEGLSCQAEHLGGGFANSLKLVPSGSESSGKMPHKRLLCKARPVGGPIWAQARHTGCSHVPRPRSWMMAETKGGFSGPRSARKSHGGHVAAQPSQDSQGWLLCT